MNKKMTIIGMLVGCLPASAAVIYVDADARGAASGSSWTDAHTSLSTAIAGASAGDQVWVAEGTYAPITLKNGVKLYGGFSGSETVASASDPAAHRSVISGGGTQQAVRSLNNDASTIMRGFVIKDGVMRDWSQAGGGLYLQNSSAVFAFCDFLNNSAVFAGGAVAIRHGGRPMFINCRFRDNGGVNGLPTPVGGGAVFNHGGSPTFANCLFRGNKGGDGGAIVSLKGSARIVNCTFTANQATNRRGGAIFDNSGRVVVRNSILWNNTSTVAGSPEIYNNATIARTTNVKHSNVKGGWSGAGNINADPLFTSTSLNDFMLQSSSPCAGLGQRAELPPDVADLDWDGNTTEPTPVDLGHSSRGNGTSVDMGAFRRASP